MPSVLGTGTTSVAVRSLSRETSRLPGSLLHTPYAYLRNDNRPRRCLRAHRYVSVLCVPYARHGSSSSNSFDSAIEPGASKHDFLSKDPGT